MGDKYQKVELIGSGTFGRVWLVLAVKTQRKYAIKEIQVAGMSGRDRDQALTEVSALGRCKHVNIIRYKEAFVEKRMLNIAMEYADGGDLHSRIKKQKGGFIAEQVVLDWYTQICFGLRYIHGRNILHRDLKSQNIFLTSAGTIKIGDFGIAKILEDTSDHARTAIGTPYYLSPEICQRKPYNHKSDIWASGCILYELVCLSHPFDGMNFSDLVLRIMQGRYKSVPSHYSALVEDLISILLRVDASKRPSARQVLCIPVMQPYVDAYVTRMHHLHGNVCQSIETMSILEKRKNPDETEGKAFLTDESEKENVSPETSTLPPKRSRKHSLSTPKQDVMKDRRSNSAESANQAGKPNRLSVKSSPKYSLYMDIINKKREQSPLASLLLKSKRGTPVKDTLNPEPRFSLCEFVNNERTRIGAQRTQSIGRTSSETKASSASAKQRHGSDDVQKKMQVDADSRARTTKSAPAPGTSSAANIPKSVAETFEVVDKEIETMRDRAKSQRKGSLDRLTIGRDAAEGSGATNDEKKESERSRQQKRSSSCHDRGRIRKRVDQISVVEGSDTSDAETVTVKPSLQMTAELMQVGRRGVEGRVSEDGYQQQDFTSRSSEAMHLGRRDSVRRVDKDGHNQQHDMESEGRVNADAPDLQRNQTPSATEANGNTSDVERKGKKDKSLEIELREIGRGERRDLSSEQSGCTNYSKLIHPASEICQKRSMETAFGAEAPKVCSKTYKVGMKAFDAKTSGSKTYMLDSPRSDGSDMESTMPTLPTVIYRKEITEPPAINQTEVTSILHQHAITGARSLLHQAESLRFLLETRMGYENFMTAYQMLKEALKTETPVEEFNAVFASYLGYHSLIFWLVQLEVASSLDRTGGDSFD